ncbi:MAG: DUF3078 domain-containing protein [Prevotellaceae bacterium]|nr:DUF3078 domain-containing protein [Candidatus Colivivens equi]
MNRFFACVVAMMFATISFAQTVNYMDSLANLSASVLNADNKTDNVELDPLLYQIFGPAIYYKGVTSQFMDMSDTDDELLASRNNLLMDMYMKFPDNFAFYDEQFETETLISKATEPEKVADEIKEVLTDVVKNDELPQMEDSLEIGLQIEKPNFWKKSGKFALQFTQNYISDNWYKGGNNNGTMLATVLLEAKYDDTKRVNWENRLDMRLGFVTATADTCHTFITNNDRLNAYSKLGIKSTKSWNYALSAEATSQFMPGYKANNKNVFSDFLAPLDVNVSLGFDYKPALKNGNTLSLALLPLSYKFRYINTDEDNIHVVYGQPADFKQDWGSKIEFNTKFTLVKNLTWRCRFYCFTSYKYFESEMENVFSYAFSKYLSTELYTLLRFGDNRSKNFYDSKLGYFQFKEYLTFGLAYSF